MTINLNVRQLRAKPNPSSGVRGCHRSMLYCSFDYFPIIKALWLLDASISLVLLTDAIFAQPFIFMV